MVKLFAIELYYKGTEVKDLKATYDLQSFGYFQRATVQEFMLFTGKIIVERSAKGSRASVKEKDYMCHVYVNQDGLSGVAITDADYPQRVAFNMLNKVLELFSSQISEKMYIGAPPTSYTFTDCQTYLEKYQNPAEADPMTRVQNELDETKVIVYNTIEQVLQRGEKLDDLVAKSEGLSTSSRTFYKTAKKTNSCCGW